MLRPAIPRQYSLNLKYIDDLSMLIAFNMKTVLIDDPVDRPRPFTFNERSSHILPTDDNLMQDQLESLHRFATGKLLRIKEKKLNVMKFNFSKSYDFPPELTISGFKQQLEVVNETRLLGVIITSDLKWNANTDFICKKAYKKMWSLRRMKLLDLEPLLMLDCEAVKGY